MATYKVLWIKKERGLEHADQLMHRVEAILNEHSREGFELDKMLPSMNYTSSDLLGMFLVLKNDDLVAPIHDNAQATHAVVH